MRRHGWLTPAWDGSWGFPRPGGAAAGGEVTTAEGRREMRAHLEGGGERGGRVKSDGDLNLAKAKYCRTVY